MEQQISLTESTSVLKIGIGAIKTTYRMHIAVITQLCTHHDHPSYKR